MSTNKNRSRILSISFVIGITKMVHKFPQIAMRESLLCIFSDSSKEKLSSFLCFLPSSKHRISLNRKLLVKCLSHLYTKNLTLPHDRLYYPEVSTGMLEKKTMKKNLIKCYIFSLWHNREVQ